MKRILRKIYNCLKCTHVIMVHHVTDEKPIIESCIISEENFDKFICEKKVVDFFTGINGLTKKEKIYIVTIDDALDDLYTNIYPKMISRGLPFTAFISVDLLDKEGYITAEQLKEMAADPLVTIGSHGCTHTKLNECNDVQAWYEIYESKEKLQKIIGKDINLYAYSNGIATKRDVKMVKKAGYIYAFGVRPRKTTFLSKIFERFMIPRYNLSNENRNPV